MKKIFLILISIFFSFVSNSVLAQAVPGDDPDVPIINQLTSDGTTVITKGCAGSTLIIKGTNFTEATAVTVNNEAVIEFTVINNTTINAILPSAATNGVVAVSTPRGVGISAIDFAVVVRTNVGSVTTSICSGATYVWPANGQSYTTEQIGTTFTSECNTAILNLSILPVTTIGSVTTSICSGATYVWPANGQSYTTEQIGTTFTSGCNTATLNLSILPVTTTGSVTTSICVGDSYVWPANGQSYSTEQIGTTFTSGCNTATLNLSILPLTTIGSVTQTQEGGSFLWLANGQTYSSSGIYKYDTGCNSATLNLTINPGNQDGSGNLESQDSPPLTITKLTSDGSTVITEGCAGSILLIKGANFKGATAVTFNDFAVSSFLVNDDTTITAVLPETSSTGLIGVTTPRGTVLSTGNFTVNAILTPTFDQVGSICYQGSVSALPIISKNGVTGIWSPALSNSTTTSYTFTPPAGVCANKATMTISVNPLPAAPTIACYQTATWNGTACAWVATGTQPAAPTGLACYQSAAFNTTTCSWVVTGTQPAAPTGLACYQNAAFNTTTCAWVISGTQSKPTSLVTNATICSGETYTWSVNSVVYTRSQTVTITNDVCTADQVLNLTEIPAPNAGTNGTLSLTSSPSDAALFAALTGADAGGTWTRPATGYIGVYTYTVSAISPCAVNATATVTVTAATVLPAADTTFNFCTGAKVSALVAATGAGVKVYAALTGGVALAEIALTGSTASPKYYYLTEPRGNGESARVRVAVIINVLPATPGTITGAAAQGPLVGTTTEVTYSISSVNGATSYEWTAPVGVNIIGANNGTSVTVNFANVSAGAGAIGTLSVKSINASGCSSVAKTLALTKALLAAPAAIKMTEGDSATAITSFAKYMGTDTVLTLTATPVVGASSYSWELPEGVTQLSGETSNVITVKFKGVTNSNTYNYSTTAGVATNVLRIGVKSVNGVGSSTTVNTTLANPQTTSTAKLLTLTATAPASPAAIKMTVGAGTTGLTNISTYIGKTTELTLTATASVLASSYEWELPEGVTKISGESSNVITVNFANVTAGTSYLYLGVKAVNGIGSSVKVNATTLVPLTSSTATLLKVTAVAPAAAGAVTGTLAICSSKASSVTYIITAAALNATKYNITAPAGCTINGGTNTATIPATASAAFTVNYPTGFTASKIVVKSISIQSENGFGVNKADKVLALTNVKADCNSTGKLEMVSSEALKVVTYPNPFTNNFNLNVITTSSENVEMRLYDMMGRLIEQHQVESNTVEVGNSYPTGIYNVIVTQGKEMKTIRVIKK